MTLNLKERMHEAVQQAEDFLALESIRRDSASRTIPAAAWFDLAIASDEEFTHSLDLLAEARP